MSQGISRVANRTIVLCFLLYSWVVLGVFIEGQVQNFRTGEKHTVTECFICLEAFLYALVIELLYANNMQ